MRKPSTECPWAGANKDYQQDDKFESYPGETCETYPVFTQIDLHSIWHGYR
jgi:hypothetical protein